MPYTTITIRCRFQSGTVKAYVVGAVYAVVQFYLDDAIEKVGGSGQKIGKKDCKNIK